METRQLFGGAITCDLPLTFVDASDFRQIPDTQEVFVAKDSGTSFILEILQKVDATDSKEAAQFLFDALAHDNDAHSSTLNRIVVSDHLVTHPDTVSARPSTPIMVDGFQLVSKFNREQQDKVHVLMAIYRIESKSVELILTANIPADDLDVAAEALLITQFEACAKSLRILDYNLFA